jgi:hypothetical protein
MVHLKQLLYLGTFCSYNLYIGVAPYEIPQKRGETTGCLWWETRPSSIFMAYAYTRQTEEEKKDSKWNLEAPTDVSCNDSALCTFYYYFHAMC